MRISHEAIYRSLFIQSRGVLKKELTAHLPTKRQMRLAKGAQSRTGQVQILDMISIRERPAEAEDRAIPGHWEGDLLTGANDTNIATLVERHSRFTMLVKVARRDSATVVAALAQTIGTLPEELRRSLTWNQNKEMARHKSFTVATEAELPQRNQPVLCLAGPTQRRRPAAQSATPKNLDFETPADRLQKVLRWPVERTGA
ncbi:IS30 family transposase [Mesorhizobium caraganae]